MARRSDGNRQPRMRVWDQIAIDATATAELHRQLATELLLLERAVVPPSDWRATRARVLLCSQLAREIRHRGEQQTLWG